jgi:signal transduction histidine kinase
MAHDLLEPLSSVTGFLRLLQRRHRAELSTDAKELLDWALRGAKEMGERVEAVLDQARLGATEPAIGPIDLAAAVERATDTLAGSITGADAVIELAEADELDADPVLFDRVLRQLLSNAIKFNRPDARPRVRISATRSGGTSELTVADNGVGIQPEYRERVLDMFVRADTERPGFGIGLAECRAIAELHGGTIRIETSDLGGAAVRATFGTR